MTISAEEKRMYDVMQAVYDGGLPVSFKGSMVLKACLGELGYPGDTRHTVDIDADWHSDPQPSAEQMAESLQEVLSGRGLGLKVRVFRRYGPGRSAGFDLADVETDEVLFTMDVDVNRPVPQTRIYTAGGVRFRGSVPVQMIADKAAVISTDKVFRRIKDVIDLYYLSHVVPFDRAAVLGALKNSGKHLEDFDGFLCRPEDLRHAYGKFRFAGDVQKPPFDEIYRTVKANLGDLLPGEPALERER